MDFITQVLKKHKVKIWIILGILGLAAFVLLRQQVSYQARIDDRTSRMTIQQKTRQLTEKLGFEIDSLAVLYHQNYSIPEKTHDNPSELPPKMGGWQIVIGQPVNDWLSLSHDPDQLYQQNGYLEFTFTRWGDLQKIRANPDMANPTFVAQDSLIAAVKYLISNPFGYNIDQFELKEVRAFSPEVSTTSNDTTAESNKGLDRQERTNEGTAFQWVNTTDSADHKIAERLHLEVSPKFRHISDSLQSRFQYGVAVNSFEAEFFPSIKGDKYPSSSSNLDILINFTSLALILGFLLFVGFRQIFRGQVDWRRALMIMMITGVIYFIGRSIYLMDQFGTFLTGGAEAVLLVGQLISSVAFGLFAGFGYVGWEALARDQKQPQVDLIDAFWRKRVFYKEMGQAIIVGVAIGWVLAGLTAAYLAFADLWYYQEPGMFYNTLTSSTYPWLSLTLTLLINGLVVSLVGFGVIRSFLREVIQHQFLHTGIAILLLGIILMAPGLFATSGTFLHEFFLLLLLVGFLIYLYDNEGIVTIFIAWFVYAGILLTSLLWAESSLPLWITSWGFASFVGLLLLYGLAAYRYGGSVKELDGYVPEYEERLAHQMRVEKEIEIARESQFKLMPVKAPQLDGVDIYGFFMPSFEVGGDYFDYVPLQSNEERDEAIAFAIADVSGKAMKAAMQAVFTSGLLLSRLHKDDPAVILREISSTIYARTDPKTFITCLVGQYNVQSNILRFANAGHCRPILKRKGKASFIYSEDPKFPLGVKSEVSYLEKSLKLKTGDFILFYSDGMPEATDKDGNQFGYNELLDLIESLDTENKSAKMIAQELKRHIQKFSDYQLADDTTLICLKI